MGIGSYPGHVFVIEEDLIEQHVPELLAEFKRLVAKYHIDVGRFIHSVDNGEDGMAIDAMEFEFTDADGEPLPFLADMNEDEYEEAALKEVCDAINAITDAFEEKTGVGIELWCPMAEDYGTAEDLELDEPYWIMVDPVDFKPEVKALGITEWWSSFRPYVFTC